MPDRGTPSRAPKWVPQRPREAWDLGSDGIAKHVRRGKTARRIDPSRRLKMDYEAFDLFAEDGVRLDAWWVHPDPVAEADRPDDGLVVVMHHHYGGQKATLLSWIHFFHRLGIPSISFDARGHAASDSSPPGRGSFMKRRQDARAAIAEARRRGARRLLGFGQSQGAAVLAMALGHDWPDELVGVVLDSGPAPDMSTAAWGLSGNLLGRNKGDTLARLLLAARILPGTEPHKYPPNLWWALLKLTRVPLLWIHGDKDDVITLDWSRTWFRSLRPLSFGRWCSLEVAGAEHVRTLQVAPGQVEEAVGNFVAGLTS
ncbi:MAG: alpha/beta hydrolase [Deltaproteobacteria bacterium]|nr:alpha/beta hydrolase [Deltaproteobacteria bacterium]